jgi:hypothetical protein
MVRSSALYKSLHALKKELKLIRRENEDINNSPGLNPLVFSSMLFCVPMNLAYLLNPQKDIFIACFLCLLTSVLNHYYKGQNQILKYIDIVFVNSCALYYTLHSLIKIKSNIYSKIMYVFAGLSGGTYLYLKAHPEIHHQNHWIIHVTSNTGIVFYILGRHKCLSY